MSERKVLNKYYPPDFDPSAIERRRGGKQQAGPKVQTVRLMAPFSMKCTSCGEYIYKGRKFNARKETTDEKYYAISIFRFYIRCTRCSAEITFKTDPKNMDYTCERGAKRNFEVWRESKLAEETEEEMLDRMEKEESERDAMKELEKKTLDAKTEMAIADALDEVRMRNAHRERADVEGAVSGVAVDRRDSEAERVEREIEEQARMAFQSGTGERIKRVEVEGEDDGSSGEAVRRVEGSVSEDRKAMPPPPAPAPTFQRQVKKKKDFAAALGIKKKQALMLAVHAPMRLYWNFPPWKPKKENYVPRAQRHWRPDKKTKNYVPRKFVRGEYVSSQLTYHRYFKVRNKVERLEQSFLGLYARVKRLERKVGAIVERINEIEESTSGSGSWSWSSGGSTEGHGGPDGPDGGMRAGVSFGESAMVYVDEDEVVYVVKDDGTVVRWKGKEKAV